MISEYLIDLKYLIDILMQKEPLKGVLRKRYFEIMQQIYPMLKGDFRNFQKDAETLLKLHFCMGVLL